MYYRFVLSLLMMMVVVGPAWSANYKIDTDHTSIFFKVKHLFSWVQGNFSEYEGAIEFDPENPGSFSAQVTIKATSIDTGVADRDKHLRSGDFFDVEKFPEISFKTVRVKDATKDGAKVHGFLSMHGVEKLVILDVEFLGVAKDPWGNVHAGFSASTEINRKDFGLTWNQTLETGGVLVGEEIKITLDVDGILVE